MCIWDPPKYTVYTPSGELLFTADLIDRFYVLRGTVEKPPLVQMSSSTVNPGDPDTGENRSAEGECAPAAETSETDTRETGEARSDAETKAVYARKGVGISKWHTRFGHTSVDTIRNMAKHESVRGLVTGNNKFDTCATCRIAKSTRASFKSSYNRLTSAPLE